MVLNARMTLASTDVVYGRRACRDVAYLRVILNRSWMEIMYMRTRWSTQRWWPVRTGHHRCVDHRVLIYMISIQDLLRMTRRYATSRQARRPYTTSVDAKVIRAFRTIFSWVRLWAALTVSVKVRPTRVLPFYSGGN